MIRKTLAVASLVSSVSLLPITAHADQELDCLIEPEMTIELGSSVDGIVQQIAVDRSDMIKAGDVLVELESAVEQAAVELAMERSKMNDTIRAKSVNSAFMARQEKRVEELHSKKAASGADKDQAETDARLAKLALETARNNKRLAELELKRAQAALEQRAIESPISGIVVDRYLNPGESVDDRPILKIAQIDPLRIEVIAPRELFGRIEKGMTAQIFPERPARGSHNATVTVVDGIVDAASGTFGVRLSVPNPNNELFGGLRCRAQFALGAQTNKPVAERGSERSLSGEPLIVQAENH